LSSRTIRLTPLEANALLAFLVTLEMGGEVDDFFIFVLPPILRCIQHTLLAAWTSTGATTLLDDEWGFLVRTLVTAQPEFANLADSRRFQFLIRGVRRKLRRAGLDESRPFPNVNMRAFPSMKGPERTRRRKPTAIRRRTAGNQGR